MIKNTLNNKLSELDIALDAAENEGSCLMASHLPYRNGVRHSLKSGDLVEPYYGLYARKLFWLSLTHKKRITHIATRLAQKIKIGVWKFTGETGAALLNLETPSAPDTCGKPIKIYVSCPYADKHAAEARSHDSYKSAKRQLRRVQLPDIIEDADGIRLEECDFKREKYGGKRNANKNADNGADNGASNEKPKNLNTTNFGHVATLEESAVKSVASIYNVLFVCAWTLPFRCALPIFDSAARNGVNLEKVYRVCSKFYADYRYQQEAADFQDLPYFKQKNSLLTYVDESDVLSRLRTLCQLADGKSENGGESLARAAMIELGFVRPELQHEFPNETNPKWPYRVDFAWKVGGKLIVGELDGADKYLVNAGKNIDFTDNGEKFNGNNEIKRNIDTIDAASSDISYDTSNNSYNSNSSNDSNISNEFILRNYDRSAVIRERDRERHLYSCGVDTIVRFDFSHVIFPAKLEERLLGAGVPKITF